MMKVVFQDKTISYYQTKNYRALCRGKAYIGSKFGHTVSNFKVRVQNERQRQFPRDLNSKLKTNELPPSTFAGVKYFCQITVFLARNILLLYITYIITRRAKRLTNRLISFRYSIMPTYVVGYKPTLVTYSIYISKALLQSRIFHTYLNIKSSQILDKKLTIIGT